MISLRRRGHDVLEVVVDDRPSADRREAAAECAASAVRRFPSRRRAVGDARARRVDDSRPATAPAPARCPVAAARPRTGDHRRTFALRGGDRALGRGRGGRRGRRARASDGGGERRASAGTCPVERRPRRSRASDGERMRTWGWRRTGAGHELARHRRRPRTAEYGAGVSNMQYAKWTAGGPRGTGGEGAVRRVAAGAAGAAACSERGRIMSIACTSSPSVRPTGWR